MTKDDLVYQAVSIDKVLNSNTKQYKHTERPFNFTPCSLSNGATQNTIQLEVPDGAASMLLSGIPSMAGCCVNTRAVVSA